MGVLEKGILRWRQKRKGLRGLQVEPVEVVSPEEKQESDVEDDFFRISRKQAEERIERSVVRVQALFRSHRAQQEYRRMKLAYDQVKVGMSVLLEIVISVLLQYLNFLCLCSWKSYLIWRLDLMDEGFRSYFLIMAFGQMVSDLSYMPANLDCVVQFGK